MIKVLGIAFIVMIGLLLLGYVITQSISNELRSQVDLEQETVDTINNLNTEYNNALNGLLICCIFLVPALLALCVLGKYTDSESNYSDVTGDNIFPIKHERIKEDAVTILKRRYANGEINSYEYTEKMSRL